MKPKQVSNFNKNVSIFYWIVAGISLVIAIGAALMLSVFAADSPLVENPLWEVTKAFFSLFLIGSIPSLLLGLLAYFTAKGSKIANILSGVICIGLLWLLIDNIVFVKVIVSALLSISFPFLFQAR